MLRTTVTATATTSCFFNLHYYERRKLHAELVYSSGWFFFARPFLGPIKFSFPKRYHLHSISQTTRSTVRATAKNSGNGCATIRSGRGPKTAHNLRPRPRRHRHLRERPAPLPAPPHRFTNPLRGCAANNRRHCEAAFSSNWSRRSSATCR